MDGTGSGARRALGGEIRIEDALRSTLDTEKVVYTGKFASMGSNVALEWELMFGSKIRPIGDLTAGAAPMWPPGPQDGHARVGPSRKDLGYRSELAIREEGAGRGAERVIDGSRRVNAT
ncbi:hypothetical protein [Micromonospora orduensis]|uniref:hypothetical protein n=1 Tax=Micromonospora orduensis TaxID=1420891 RepID=UPI0033DFBAC9